MTQGFAHEMDPTQAISAELRRLLPRQFLIRLVQEIFQCYEQVHIESCREVEPEQVKRDRSQRRSFRMDARFKRLAHQFYRMQGAIKETDPRGHEFAELIIDERLILNICAVRDFDDLPSKSKNRRKKSELNAQYRQLNILDSIESGRENTNLVEVDFENRRQINRQRRQDEGMFYAIITHGPRQKELPEFIYVRVPDRDYNFSMATIDVLGDFYSYRNDIENTNHAEDENQVEPIQPPVARLRDVPVEDIEVDDDVAGEGEVEDDEET
jgi:hypothetical protein